MVSDIPFGREIKGYREFLNFFKTKSQDALSPQKEIEDNVKKGTVYEYNDLSF